MIKSKNQYRKGSDSLTNTDSIEAIQAKINDLKKRMPAHSVKPIMIQELEQLEEKLAQLLSKE
jgi:hypothetical protein